MMTMMTMISKSHPYLVGRNACYNRILSSSLSSRKKCFVSTFVVHSNQQFLKSSLFSGLVVSLENEYPSVRRQRQQQQYFSSQPNDSKEDEEKEEGKISREMEQELDKRHHGIMMNPNGLSRTILPGNFVIKTNEKTGSKRKVHADRALGYFWMIKV